MLSYILRKDTVHQFLPNTNFTTVLDQNKRNTTGT